jgi:hypothetical protein
MVLPRITRIITIELKTRLRPRPPLRLRRLLFLLRLRLRPIKIGFLSPLRAGPALPVLLAALALPMRLRDALAFRIAL